MTRKSKNSPDKPKPLKSSIKKHFKVLGVKNEDEYFAWCQRRNFVSSLDSFTSEARHLKKDVEKIFMKKKKPLFRKVNTKTYGIANHKAKHRQQRNTELCKKNPSAFSAMKKPKHGLDYTPLFKFLLSKVGYNWDEIFSEAKSRLDKVEPIFWMVSLNEVGKKRFVRLDESTYFSGLFVDDSGILQLVDPTLTINQMFPFCECCTHTFNGDLFTQKYKAPPF